MEEELESIQNNQSLELGGFAFGLKSCWEESVLIRKGRWIH